MTVGTLEDNFRKFKYNVLTNATGLYHTYELFMESRNRDPWDWDDDIMIDFYNLLYEIPGKEVTTCK